MKITKHAYKRAKERLGLSSTAFDHLSSKALTDNFTHKATKGNLHKWVTSIVLRYKFKPIVYLYSDFMLVTLADRIITVLKIPRNLLPLHKQTTSKFKPKSVHSLAPEAPRATYEKFLDNEQITQKIEFPKELL